MTPGFNTDRRYANSSELEKMLFMKNPSEYDSQEEACSLGGQNTGVWTPKDTKNCPLLTGDKGPNLKLFDQMLAKLDDEVKTGNRMKLTAEKIQTAAE